MNELIYSNSLYADDHSALSTNLKPYENIMVFDELPTYDDEEYDIFDEKDFKKYIADIENKCCRGSFEYRMFVDFLKNYMDMKQCAYLSHVTNSESSKIKIHLHHSPFTLYDIVMTVFNKRMYYGESLEVEMVAKEVMYIHYFLMVGIIPLSETVHELVHSQIIFIPIDNVMGKYSEFEEIYKDFIPEDAMERYEAAKNQSKEYNDAVARNKLQLSPIVVNLPDGGGEVYNLPKTDDIIALMQNRIQEIKDNNYVLPSLVDSTYQNAFGYTNDSEDGVVSAFGYF